MCIFITKLLVDYFKYIYEYYFVCDNSIGLTREFECRRCYDSGCVMNDLFLNNTERRDIISDDIVDMFKDNSECKFFYISTDYVDHVFVLYIDNNNIFHIYQSYMHKKYFHEKTLSDDEKNSFKSLIYKCYMVFEQNSELRLNTTKKLYGENPPPDLDNRDIKNIQTLIFGASVNRLRTINNSMKVIKFDVDNTDCLKKIVNIIVTYILDENNSKTDLRYIKFSEMLLKISEYMTKYNININDIKLEKNMSVALTQILELKK